VEIFEVRSNSRVAATAHNTRNILHGGTKGKGQQSKDLEWVFESTHY
jgi:hypothetical protein